MIAFGVHTIFMLGIFITSIYIFIKATQFLTSIKLKIIFLVWCILLSIVYAISPTLMPILLYRLIMCVLTIILIFVLARLKIDTIIAAFLLSFGISYFLFYLASFAVSFISALIVSREYMAGSQLVYHQPIYLVIYGLIFILQILLAFLVFRIRRFRKGFPFLFKRQAVVVALIVAGSILILVTWVNRLAKSEVFYYQYYLTIAGVVIIAVGIYIWIRRGIRMFQRKRMEQRREAYLEQQLEERDEEIERLVDKNREMQKVIHNFTHRLESMESSALGQGDEVLEDIQDLQQEFQDQLAKIKGKKSLPTTNISRIDNIFHHFAKQFNNDEIDFKVVINGSIIYMIDHVIELGDLETIIANHLRNAQIAVNAGDNTFRSIMAVIGISGDHYTFTVFDSGIPFKTETLEKLGSERVTTHADEGGSGIGLMTTFEFKQKYGASLTVNEQEPSVADYTKSISIIFDGEGQYTIQTYRKGALMDSDRYILEEH